MICYWKHGRKEVLTYTENALIQWLLIYNSLMISLSLVRQMKSQPDAYQKFWTIETGLHINNNKSFIVFSPCSKLLQQKLAKIADIPIGSLLFKYLGIPITTKKPGGLPSSRGENCLSNWKSKTLSYAGRVELIRYARYGTITYWCCALKLPNATIDKLNQLMSRFL